MQNVRAFQREDRMFPNYNQNCTKNTKTSIPIDDWFGKKWSHTTTVTCLGIVRKSTSSTLQLFNLQPVASTQQVGATDLFKALTKVALRLGHFSKPWGSVVLFLPTKFLVFGFLFKREMKDNTFVLFRFVVFSRWNHCMVFRIGFDFYWVYCIFSVFLYRR